GSTPALLGATVDDVLGTARTRAAALGIEPTSRVLSTLDWSFPGGVLDGLVAVLCAGASLVQVSNSDSAKLPGHSSAERTTLDRPGRGVLFRGPHNAGGSQMALGFLTQLAGAGVPAWSSGSDPAAAVNPAAVAAMAERGIDISAAQPKRWTDEI